MKGLAVIALGLLFWICGSASTYADRDYLFSQGYQTTRKGELEWEVYSDYNMRDFDNDDTHSFKQQHELEYGLTHRWQWAYYEVFRWDQPNDWQRDSFKIETKYRFLESGELPVDIALYGEYKNPNGRQKTASDELEGKLILSRDFGLWNVVANLITERKINEHEDLQWEYTAGISRALNSRVRLGLEVKETRRELQLMPVVAAMLTPHSRILFGPAFGLTRASDDLQLRSILEIEF